MIKAGSASTFSGVEACVVSASLLAAAASASSSAAACAAFFFLLEFRQQKKHIARIAKTTAPPTAPPTIAPILGPPDGPLGFAVVVGTFVVVDLEVGSEVVATVFVVVV